jgi:hypothetical protein
MGLPHTKPTAAGILLEKTRRTADKMLLRNANDGNHPIVLRQAAFQGRYHEETRGGRGRNESEPRPQQNYFFLAVLLAAGDAPPSAPRLRKT